MADTVKKPKDFSKKFNKWNGQHFMDRDDTWVTDLYRQYTKVSSELFRIQTTWSRQELDLAGREARLLQIGIAPEQRVIELEKQLAEAQAQVELKKKQLRIALAAASSELKRLGKDRFLEGYVCACAITAKLDTPTDAQELLKQGGFSYEDLIAEGVEQGDIDAIYPTEAKESLNE
jgi:hypothetical protein